jgi:DNA-binding beta-propeller fold protein YncE
MVPWGIGVFADDQVAPAQTAPRLQPLFAIYMHMDQGFFNNPMGIFYDRRTGEIYVADTSNDLIGIFNAKGVSLFSLGANEDIKGPVKAITDTKGRILVLDNERKLKVLNYRGEYLEDLDLPGLPPKKSIGAMAVDAVGNLYIAENETAQILVFGPDLRLKTKFGGKGTEKGQFQSVGAIAVGGDGRIYVTDHLATPVQVFDGDGKFLIGWGKHETGVENFSLPGGIAVDSKGRVFIVDTLRHEIKIFTREGKFLGRDGGFGYKPGDVAFPVDIDIDPADRIYVVEKVGKRVQVFQEVESPPKPRS